MTNIKESDCLKALSSNPEIIPFVKDSIMQSVDGYVRILASEIKELMGPIFEKENDIDIYLCLRCPLFYEEGLIIERGKTKKKENVFIFRNIERFDEPPPAIPKIDKIEIVPGTNEILKAMHTFDKLGFKGKFIPEDIVKFIEDHKDIIRYVESITNSVIATYLNMENINKNCEEGLKKILDLIYNFDADTVYYNQEDNSIDFEWINQHDIENMSLEDLRKYYKRYDKGEI